MKLAPLFAAILLLGCAGIAFADQPLLDEHFDIDAWQQLKDAHITGTPNPGPRVGGEDVGNATVIPGIPYTDTGNTCTFNNDYDEICPFNNPNAPDVVYSYTPGANVYVDISLCNSSYDTKLYVYENAVTAGSPYACNDDACSGPNFPFPYLSSLSALPLTGGNTYYIVVDGYDVSCGEYEINVSEFALCDLTCPTGALQEGEPVCYDNYQDTYNAGCNSDPPTWVDVHCTGAPVTYCGTSGNFLDSGIETRDTDFYRVVLSEAATLKACLEAQFNAAFFILSDVTNDCLDAVLECQASPGECQVTCCEVALPAGEYWIFVSTLLFTGYPCGAEYVLTIDTYPCVGTATEGTSWGNVKELFR